MNMERNVLAKLRLDLALLSIRAVTIVVWLGFLWMSIEMQLSLQVCFTAIIFLSDAFDGIISRKFCLPLEQYRFRILDTVVDKIGILLFLVTLLYLKRISHTVIYLIMGYHILLILFPIAYILSGHSKNIAWIQATMCSRLYAISIGLYCFFSIVCDTALAYKREWALYFLVLGMVSLVSHIVKIKKLKEHYNNGYL